MPKQGYVKTSIKSGASSNLLTVEPSNKAIRSVPYHLDTRPMYERNTAPFFMDEPWEFMWTTEPDNGGSGIDVYVRCSPDRVAYFDQIDITTQSLFNASFTPTTAYKFGIEVAYVTVTGTTSDATGTYLQFPPKNIEETSTSRVAFYRGPLGLSNIKTIFSGYFHSQTSVSPTGFTGDGISLNFPNMFGKGLKITGYYTGIRIKIVSGTNLIFPLFNMRWKEYLP